MVRSKKNLPIEFSKLFVPKVWSGRFWMGKFNGKSPKPHIVFSNDREMIVKLCTRAGQMTKSEFAKCPVRTAKTYLDKRGVKRSVGLKKEMRDSQPLR